MSSFMITSVSEASVVSLMRIYERAAFDVLGLKVFAWNRTSGPLKNKNFKVWARLRTILDHARADAALFMWDSMRMHIRLRPDDAKKHPPFVTQLTNPAYMREHLRRAKRPRAQVAKLDFYLWEIEEGAAILRGLLPPAPTAEDYVNLMCAAWTMLPPTYLACDNCFYSLLGKGSVQPAIAAEHYSRVTDVLELLLSPGYEELLRQTRQHYLEVWK